MTGSRRRICNLNLVLISKVDCDFLVKFCFFNSSIDNGFVHPNTRTSIDVDFGFIPACNTTRNEIVGEHPLPQ